MSIADLSSSTPAAYSILNKNSDADFDLRWNAWTTRGLAHERRVRQRSVVAIEASAIALAAVIAYGLLSS